MPRKSVKVADILRDANKRLGVPDSERPGLADMSPFQAYRLGVASLAECVLHGADAYAGFGYIDSPFVAGQTDETRRVYYVHWVISAAYSEAATPAVSS
jgi:hypothetical protein